MKIIRDTMMKNGRYDKQAITMFASFAISTLIGFYIVLSDYFLKKEINQYAIMVFMNFIGLAAGTSVINVWNKKVDRKTEAMQDNSEQAL